MFQSVVFLMESSDYFQILMKTEFISNESVCNFYMRLSDLLVIVCTQNVVDSFLDLAI